MSTPPRPTTTTTTVTRTAAVVLGLGTLGVVLALNLPADAGGDGGGELLPLPSTDADFFQQGTQPAMEGVDAIVDSMQCAFCHSNYDPVNEPYATWISSVMGQSARDPMFWAGVEVANADAEGAGQLCIRCHAPGAFLGCRADPPDGSAFTGEDMQGIMCNFCHRVVDQDYKPGVSPTEDESILQSLSSNVEYWPDGLIPPQGSNARYVVDPVDSRRGPYDDLPFNPHLGNPQAPVIVSPHHRTSELCWTCHDVSNPLIWRDHENGGFFLGDLETEHPTQDQEDMFPLHRTYSEWLNSYYHSLGGVQHHGRFGGNHPTGVMNVCQDCHLPDQQAFGCNLGDPFPLRDDMPQHSFVGSNTWVVGAVRELFGEAESGLTQEMVDAARARNIDLLENASDLELDQEQTRLRARVINQGGHKLPTGFPDGRRVWINAKFYDRDEVLLVEHGAYDFDEAHLTEDDTTVFECILGIDETQSGLTGLDVGPTFHFVLANVILKDNRIPPQGLLERPRDRVAASAGGRDLRERAALARHAVLDPARIGAGSGDRVLPAHLARVRRVPPGQWRRAWPGRVRRVGAGGTKPAGRDGHDDARARQAG